MTHSDDRAAHDSDRAVPPAAARAALNRILASPSFAASPRKARFLAYIVDLTLAGQGDQVTAYDIAINVFDRDERFDPQTDPLVRIAARRLRDALDHHYLTDGRADPVRIAIPKGHYVPTFRLTPVPSVARQRFAKIPGSSTITRLLRRRVGAPPVLATGAALLLVGLVSGWYAAEMIHHPDVPSPAVHSPGKSPRIAVAPIGSFNADPSLDRMGQKLTEQIKLVLCCESRFHVVPATSVADYHVNGSIQAEPAGLGVELMLSAAATRQVLWSHTYMLPAPTRAAMADAGILHTIAAELEKLDATPR